VAREVERGHLFEQAFKNIDDILRKEAGCTTELDYTEQSSWLLFLKYLDGLEQDEIFGEIKNKIQSGYNMREIIDEIDALRFRSQAEKYELSHLYEAKIRNMGNAGRNGGEYYTPRPLNDDDLTDFVQLQKTKAGSPKSWNVDAKTIDHSTFDLSVKNPNAGEEVTHHNPLEIMNEIAALDAESAKVLAKIRDLL
jgi:hypothetical protein